MTLINSLLPCSVTVVLAYLIKTRGMTLSQALEYVRSKRPQASPNAGFIKQLQDFEQSLRGVLSSLNLMFLQITYAILIVSMAAGFSSSMPTMDVRRESM